MGMIDEIDEISANDERGVKTGIRIPMIESFRER